MTIAKVTIEDVKGLNGIKVGSIIRWNDLKDNDEGSWIEVSGSKAVIQVVRFKEGVEMPAGNCAIEGRNANDVDGQILNSTRNNKMQFSNSDIDVLTELPRYIRPVARNVSNGSFSIIVNIAS